MDKEEVATIERMSRDIREAASTLSDRQARFLVDTFYQMQDQRIRAGNQLRSLVESEEPHATIGYVRDQSSRLENQIKGALDVYSDSSPLGLWTKSITGIAEVLAAGFLSHVDVTVPTAGAIWRYAGLDPSIEWLSRAKAKELYEKYEEQGLSPEASLCQALIHRCLRVDRWMEFASHDREGNERPITKKSACAALARRPWSAKFKTLCWKLGDCFVKTCNHKDSFYGPLYTERKALEVMRNNRGDFEAQAANILKTKDINKETVAYKNYCKGRLPKAHVHQRACRWTVKLFISHFHEVGHKLVTGNDPPAPYAMAIAKHTHKIDPPVFSG